MKTLYLVRHAKSSWSLPELPDIDRPLNERGYHDAHLIGKKLHQQIKTPELMISSPAVRALTTALIFSRALGYPEENILIRSGLYETGLEDYFKVIAAVPESVGSLMLYAHNYTISEMAPRLLGAPFDEMSTCAVLSIDFAVDKWEDIAIAPGTQGFYIFPKLFKEL